MLCSSDSAQNPGMSRTNSKNDADDWSVEVGSQAEALSRCTSSDGDDLSKSSIGTDRRRNRQPRSKQCRRRTSKINEPDSSRRHTQHACDNEERDGAPSQLPGRIHHHRNSPHVRRSTNLRRT